MSLVIAAPGGTVNLQSTLASASVTSNAEPVKPHHPITCPSNLRFEDDGMLRCEHAEVPSGDLRTQHCLDHSVALLLIELIDAL